ncbi:MAG: hypothetical protein ACFE0Q_07520 [Anaerolineae bacterium]
MIYSLIFGLACVVAFVVWYRYEVIHEADATIHLQSEHEHFHFHVELPDHLTIQPGDTLHILSVPEHELDAGRTDGEISYQSRIRLHKASWLQRHLTKTSSLIEVSELVDHP